MPRTVATLCGLLASTWPSGPLKSSIFAPGKTYGFRCCSFSCLWMSPLLPGASQTLTQRCPTRMGIRAQVFRMTWCRATQWSNNCCLASCSGRTTQRLQNEGGQRADVSTCWFSKWTQQINYERPRDEIKLGPAKNPRRLWRVCVAEKNVNIGSTEETGIDWKRTMLSKIPKQIFRSISPTVRSRYWELFWVEAAKTLPPIMKQHTKKQCSHVLSMQLEI